MAIFWVLPFIAGIIAAGVAGDCDWESGACTDVQSTGAFLVVALAFFWIFVSAPVTLVLGTAWLLSMLVRRSRRSEKGASDATSLRPHTCAPPASVARRAGGVDEAYLWVLAGVGWCIVLVGIIVVATEEGGSFAGLAALLFGAFMAVPLTATLVIGWSARVLRRKFR